MTSFKEKPTAADDLVNGGFFVLSPSVLDRIAGDDTVWEQAPMESLARDGKMLAFRHTGFKGAWAVPWLHALGARVYGFSDILLPGRSLFRDAGPLPLARDGCGDIREAGAVRDAVAGSEPEVVIHLAAQSLVRASYAEPAATFAANVMGTVHLLEAVRSLGGTCPVIVVTSDKCYENRETGHAYRDGDPLGGHDPYSANKACAEIATMAYARSFPGRIRVATARAGNVVGGGDWAPDRLVPDLVRGLRANRVVEVRNPGAVRPWQHVLEPLCGFRPRLRHGAASRARPGSSARIRAPRRRSAPWRRRSAASGIGPTAGARRRNPGAPTRRTCCISIPRRRARLGWAPRWDLATALAASVALYRADLSGAELRRLALGQIADYSMGPDPAGARP